MKEYIDRYMEAAVIEDLKRKMVFVGGPRQSGKTTLAKHLCTQAGCGIEERFLNWDAAEDREQIILERFPTAPGLMNLAETGLQPVSALHIHQLPNRIIPLKETHP